MSRFALLYVPPIPFSQHRRVLAALAFNEPILRIVD